MADANTTAFLLGLLRKVGPAYRFLRKIWREVRRSGVELTRVFFKESERLGAPLGFFSGLEQVRQGVCKGRVVIEGQHLPHSDSGSLRTVCGLGQNGRQPWPIFWMHAQNARLVGPSLVMRDRSKRLLLEACFGPEFAEADPANLTIYLPPATHLEGRWTSVVNRWGDNFYHWLTDNLPRLALLSEFPADTRILVPSDLKGYQLDSLRILGLEDRVRPTPEVHLLVEDYFFSSPTGMTGCDNYYNLSFLRERCLGAAVRDPELPRRIFIRRRGKTRGIRNDVEVIQFFAELGWQIVDLETLSLSRQIGLFAEVEAICALHGAALTNLAWCKPGCRVIELFASNFLNGCYEGMAACLGLSYSYLIFPGDGHFQIKVDLRALEKRLREMGL